MKFSRSLIVILSCAALAVPLFVYADAGAGLKAGLLGAGSESGLASSCTGLSCIVTTIGRVIYAALGFLGVGFLILMLYAGFRWMTAGGDKTGVEEATKIIRNAIVGMIIIMFSYAITTFVLDTLGSSTGGAPPESAATEKAATSGRCTCSGGTGTVCSARSGATTGACVQAACTTRCGNNGASPPLPCTASCS